MSPPMRQMRQMTQTIQIRQRVFIPALVAGIMAISTIARAQVTPAAGYTPPDDTPVIRIGATIFGDFTIQDKPKVTDADNNTVTLNQFNVGRAYINVTGNISH